MTTEQLEGLAIEYQQNGRTSYSASGYHNGHLICAFPVEVYSRFGKPVRFRVDWTLDTKRTPKANIIKLLLAKA